MPPDGGRIRMWRPLLMTAAWCALVAPGPAAAQVVQGRILDAADGRSLAHAQVLVLRAEGDSVLQGMVASGQGGFRFQVGEPGGYRLRVELLGYASVTTLPFRLEPLQVRTVEVRMDRETIVLDALTVVAERMEPVFLADVRRREREGSGRFIYREELEDHAGSRLQDLLAALGGLTVSYLEHSPGRGRERGDRPAPILVPVVTGRQSGLRQCYASVYFNGALLFSNDQLEFEHLRQAALERLSELFDLRPDEMEAMEIYRGTAQVPAEFTGSASHCGVVAIWTRGGRVEWRASRAPPASAPPFRFRVGVMGKRHRLSGPLAPEGGIGLEATSWVVATPLIGIAAFVGYGRYTLPGATMTILTRPERGVSHESAAAPLTLLSAGLEPRVVLRETGPARALLTARGLLGYRSFAASSGVPPARHSSWGWGLGMGAALEVDLPGRLTVDVAYGRDRYSFRPYATLEKWWRSTTARWSGGAVRLGVSRKL